MGSERRLRGASHDRERQDDEPDEVGVGVDTLEQPCTRGVVLREAPDRDGGRRSEADDHGERSEGEHAEPSSPCAGRRHHRRDDEEAEHDGQDDVHRVVERRHHVARAHRPHRVRRKPGNADRHEEASHPTQARTVGRPQDAGAERRHQQVVNEDDRHHPSPDGRSERTQLADRLVDEAVPVVEDPRDQIPHDVHRHRRDASRHQGRLHRHHVLDSLRRRFCGGAAPDGRGVRHDRRVPRRAWTPASDVDADDGPVEPHQAESVSRR